jgi:hypothetical protein
MKKQSFTTTVFKAEYSPVDSIMSLKKFQPVIVALLKKNEISTGWVHEVHPQNKEYAFAGCEGVDVAELMCFDGQTIVFAGNNEYISVSTPINWLRNK